GEEARPEAVAQPAGASGARTGREAEEKTALVGDGPAPIEERARPPAPSAAKLMEEHGLTTSEVPGSGKAGQVLKGDVLAAIERKGQAAAEPAARSRAAPSEPAEMPKVARPPSAAEDEAREERVKMTRLRQTIARRLKDAQNT